MPLGPGGYDSNGIWLYGEDDSEALASDLLNLGMQSVSDALGSAGGLVSVKSALFTGTQSASVTAGSNVAVTDLSITHEVASASNKLIITAFFGVAASSDNRGNVGIGVAVDGTLIGVGDSAGSRTSVSAGGEIAINNTSSYLASMPSISYVYTPGSGSKVYTVRAINIQTSTKTMYVNRINADDDGAYVPRGASALIIQEVSV